MRKLKSMVSALALISALALTSCQQPSTPEVGDSTTTPQTNTSELTLEEVNKMFGDTIVALNGANYIDFVKSKIFRPTGELKDIYGKIISSVELIKDNKYQVESITTGENVTREMSFIIYQYSIINYKIVKTDTGDDLIYMTVFVKYPDIQEMQYDAIQPTIFNPKTGTIIFHDQYGSVHMSKLAKNPCSKNYILSKATAEEVQADFTEKDIEHFIALTCAPDNTFIYNENEKEKENNAPIVLNKVVETPIVVEKNKIKFGEQTADYTINAEDIAKIDISNSSITALPDGTYSYLITANVKDGKNIPGLTLTNTTNGNIKYTLGSSELINAVVPIIEEDPLQFG